MCRGKSLHIYVYQLQYFSSINAKCLYIYPSDEKEFQGNFSTVQQNPSVRIQSEVLNILQFQQPYLNLILDFVNIKKLPEKIIAYKILSNSDNTFEVKSCIAKKFVVYTNHRKAMISDLTQGRGHWISKHLPNVL